MSARSAASGLKAGEVITTGTCITPLEIAAGDAIMAEFPGLGRVSVHTDIKTSAAAS